ncbi:hypothetical protein M9Y10_000876 [Tritrichomonas musculus]|uniref:Uncharacterized protein n=1 Tax=Tritrichomonas musculus TaxID=1915356 RepID=A0ABR2L5E3_9EUKA
MLLFLISLIFIRTKVSDALKCITGAWAVENSCEYIQNHFTPKNFQIKIEKRSFLFRDFIVDINPGRWMHPNAYFIKPIKGQINKYSVKNNRQHQVGEVTLAFGPHCEVRIGHMTTDTNFSVFGHVSSGEGFISFSTRKDSCQLKTEKIIQYSNWRFGLTIFTGIAAMYIGFQTFFGWSLDIISKPQSIPIDNPGEEYILAPNITAKKKMTEREEGKIKDEYKSEDGY